MKKRPAYLQSLIYALLLGLLATGTSASTSVSRLPRLLVQRADQSLWLYPLDGGAGQQLTPSLTSGTDVVTWSLSPDQQWLAYIQMRNWRKEGADQGQALLLNVVTGEKRVLLDAMLPAHYNWQVAPWDTDRAIIESEPVWSKDSQRFTLISDHTASVSLYVYNLRTNDLRLLTQGQHNIAWPQWSPDEQYLLYNEIEAFGTGAGPTGGALWVVPSVGPAPARRLSQNEDQFEFISQWVDDTHIITFKSSLAGRSDWNTVEIHTGQRTPAQVQPEPAFPCWHYSLETNTVTKQWTSVPAEPIEVTCNGFSPQSRWAYILLDSTMDQPSRLYLVDINTQVKTLLTERPFPSFAAFDAAWSPDGHYLIWLAPNDQTASSQNPDYDLWAIAVEQRQPFRVAERVAFWGKRVWIK